MFIERSWRNGRRASLRGWWGQPRGGSSPLGRIKIRIGKKGWEKTQSLNKENPQLFHFEGVGDFIVFKDTVSQIPYNLSTTKNQRSDSPCIKIITQWKRP